MPPTSFHTGAFAYWDASDEICHMKAVKQVINPSEGLAFDGPHHTNGEMRKYLIEHNRIHPVTLPNFLERGIIGFCWLAPNEKLGTGSEGERAKGPT